MQEKLVFIDETGDVGRSHAHSSNLFAIAAVVIEPQKAEALRHLVNGARKKWRKRELKFSRLSEKQRRWIFHELKGHDFYYYSVVVNKHLLYSRGFLYTDVFYKHFFGKLLSEISQDYCEISVHFDEFGDASFHEGLKKYIRKRYAQRGLFEPHAIVAENSEFSELTQLADLVAGAIGRATNTHKHRDRDLWFLTQLVRHRRRIRFWPPEGDSDGASKLIARTQDDERLEKESERRLRLILKRGDLESAQLLGAELLLYGDAYIASDALVTELDNAIPETIGFDQRRQWVQRHVIRFLRDNGALIDSNSGTLDSGYSLIRRICQAKNFHDCQVRRATAMLRRAQAAADAVAVATESRVSIESIPQDTLLLLMRMLTTAASTGTQTS